MLPPIPASWRAQVGDEVNKPYFRRLQEFIESEREAFEVYPAEPDTFQALQLTPFRNVNVLLLGQDPYPGPNQAHGLCFSVKPGVGKPASLRNIFIELENDISGFRIPNNGYLASWAQQGILMLNTVLTVRKRQIGSHRGKGWEIFTDKIIERVNNKRGQVVFVLWGRDAQSKIELIDTSRHVILKAAHPSPNSADRGFFGKRPFSAINSALKKAGKPEINWQIPDI
ncbi:MAG TPA: uracil-DNA glycosylase [Pyrinomonadaceae bacterium]|jgi:uracil-DNA glycosylase